MAENNNVDGKQLTVAEKPKHEGRALTQNGNFKSLVPKDFAEAEHIAKILANSDIVPKEFIGKPANILLAIMFGNEIGLAPAQALQNVMVVNGRPSLWGDSVMGMVKASSVYEASRDEFDEKTMTATFHVKRKGEDWMSRSFSQADAQKAGLWSKSGPWSTYPKRMLFQRARAWALRDCFPDVLKGLRITEEERDVIDVEPQNDGVYAMPQRTAQPATEPAAAAEPVAQVEDKPKSVTIEAFGVGKTERNGSTLYVIRRESDQAKFFTDSEAFAREAAGAKKLGLAIVLGSEARDNGEIWVTSLVRVEEK